MRTPAHCTMVNFDEINFDELFSSNILHNVVNVPEMSVQNMDIFIKALIWGILIG